MSGSAGATAAVHIEARGSSTTCSGVIDLGIRLGASVMIGFFAGLALDGLLGTRPLLILVGTTFGVAAAMYSIWDVARKAMRK